MLAVEMERKEQDQWETVAFKDLLLLVLIICTYVSISEYQELELDSFEPPDTDTENRTQVVRESSTHLT